MPESSNVNLQLSRDEALVLFEFLQREIDENDANTLKSSIDHEAELWALNGLNCLLERALPEPFASDYLKDLSAARHALVKRYGNWSFVSSTE